MRGFFSAKDVDGTNNIKGDKNPEEVMALIRRPELIPSLMLCAR